MYISNMLGKLTRPSLSFEVFPPKKTEMIEKVQHDAFELAELKPDFISVTYGAGGGTKLFSADLAADIQNHCDVTVLSHLTCVSATKSEIAGIIADFKQKGIKNVLAMRGDIPADVKDFPNPKHYRYACDLVSELKAAGDFCIAGACYPEGHIESPDLETDLNNLKNKVDCGCDFLITQLFFDNAKFLQFRERCAAKGINVPILAGIMPVQNASQIKKMCSMSGATLPPKFTKMLEKYENDPDALKEAGIAYAVEQINELLSRKVDGIHIYTMNKPATALKIVSAIDLARERQ